MRSSIIHIAVALASTLHILCHAQDTPPAGTIYNEINGNCPIYSVTASAATGMIIWPVKNDRTNSTTMNATRDALETYLDNPSDKAFWNYTSEVDGLLLWYTYLNDGQACDIAEFSGVSVLCIQSCKYFD